MFVYSILKQKKNFIYGEIQTNFLVLKNPNYRTLKEIFDRKLSVKNFVDIEDENNYSLIHCFVSVLSSNVQG